MEKQPSEICAVMVATVPAVVASYEEFPALDGVDSSQQAFNDSLLSVPQSPHREPADSPMRFVADAPAMTGSSGAMRISEFEVYLLERHFKD